MALIDAFPGVSNKVDSTELRKDLAGLIVRDTNGVPRGGIFPRHANALISARSDMKLNVAAFEGVSVRGGGPLFMANDGVDLTPLIPIPLANSQTSVIYFKQNESGSPYLDANDLPIIGIVTGAASASPVKPSIAGIAGAEELGTVTVPFDATATNSVGVVVTPTHRFTTTAGGVLWFRDSSERDAFSTAGTGQKCYRLDKLWTETFSSGGWRAEPGAQHIEFTTTVAAADATAFAVGAVTVDSSASTDTTLVAPIANGLRFQPGVYAVHVSGNLTAAATGRSYIGVESFAGAPYYARAGIPVGENVFSVSIPNLRITAANTDVALTLFQTTGASRTIVTRVRVTRVG